MWAGMAEIWYFGCSAVARLGVPRPLWATRRGDALTEKGKSAGVVRVR